MNTTHKCQVCGHELPPSSGRGRPRLYHPDCKALIDRLRFVKATLGKIKFTTTAARAFRAELFADIGNEIRPWIDREARARFAEAIRNGRERLGISQAELAERAEIKGEKPESRRRRLGKIESADHDVAPTKGERRRLLAIVGGAS